MRLNGNINTNNEVLTERQVQNLLGKKVTRRGWLKATGAATLAIACTGVGTGLAWFTAKDVKVNPTAVAENLAVKVVEPNWDPEAAKAVVPTQVVAKDPQIGEYGGHLLRLFVRRGPHSHCDRQALRRGYSDGDWPRHA